MVIGVCVYHQRELTGLKLELVLVAYQQVGPVAKNDQLGYERKVARYAEKNVQASASYFSVVHFAVLSVES